MKYKNNCDQCKNNNNGSKIHLKSNQSSKNYRMNDRGNNNNENIN